MRRLPFSASSANPSNDDDDDEADFDQSGNALCVSMGISARVDPDIQKCRANLPSIEQLRMNNLIVEPAQTSTGRPGSFSMQIKRPNVHCASCVAVYVLHCSTGIVDDSSMPLRIGTAV